jgi:dCMP deaminase
MRNALVAFVPVLHAGYVDLFRKYPGVLYLIGPEFIPESFHLEREIRAIPLPEIKKMIETLAIFSKVFVLDKENLEDLAASDFKIVLPAEDVSEFFAKTYLKNKQPVFESVFLRWNRKISDTEYEVAADRVVSDKKLDRRFMDKAGAEASKSSDWWRQIGAVAVKNGKVLFSAHNRHLPTDFHLAAFGDPRSSFNAGERPDVYTSIHAEAAIVAEAAREGRSLDGASIYVSTFPCPNCARLLTKAGVKKLYYQKGYSLRDAETILKSAGVEIILVK